MVKSQKVSDDSMLETEVLWSKLEGTERGCLERLTPYERIEGLIGFRAGVWARWLVVAACLMLCHFNSSFAGADATGVRLGCCNPQRDIFCKMLHVKDQGPVLLAFHGLFGDVEVFWDMMNHEARLVGSPTFPHTAPGALQQALWALVRYAPSTCRC